MSSETPEGVEEQNDQNLKVGVVGYGSLGKLSAEAVSDIDGAEVAAVGDISEQKLSEAADDLDDINTYDTVEIEEYGRMIDEEELDGMIITTPHAIHHEQIEAALDKGLDVAVDKPLTVEPENAASVIQKSEETGNVVSVGYQRQFQQFGDISNIIDGGVLGDIEGVDADLSQYWIHKHEGEWRQVPELSGGGNLMDSGSHIMYGILESTDSVVDEVSAEMDWYEEGVEEYAELEAKLDRDDQQDLFDLDLSVGGYVDEVEGWNERIEIQGSEADLVWHKKDDHEEFYLKTDEGIEHVDYSDQGYGWANHKKIGEYLDVLSGEADRTEVVAEEAFRVVSATDAAYESAKNGGQTVKVENDWKNYLE